MFCLIENVRQIYKVSLESGLDMSSIGLHTHEHQLKLVNKFGNLDSISNTSTLTSFPAGQPQGDVTST